MKLVNVIFSVVNDKVRSMEEVTSSPEELKDTGTEGLYEESVDDEDTIENNIQAVECSDILDCKEYGLMHVYMKLDHIPEWVDKALESGKLKFAPW